jgi:hypothetical protein
MNRKWTFWTGLLLGITLSAVVTASTHQSWTPTRPNTTEVTRRTIPKEFGRVIGTEATPSLVMEAADGTIRVVPFDHDAAIGVFPRN